MIPRMRVGTGIILLVFLASVPALRAQDITVTTAADSGGGSLREAVTTANGTPEADYIDFQPNLGIITLTSGQLTVDGRVHIDGKGQTIASNTANSVFVLASSSHGSTLTGMAVYNAGGGGIAAIRITTNCNRITNCRLGTDWEDNTGLGMTYGINLSGHYNDIGGSTAAERNVISGNIGAGIHVDSTTPVFGNRIRGNYIGTDSSGQNALHNASYGIFANALSYTLIGGDRSLNDGEGNVISGNSYYGLLLHTNNCFGNTICGNVIGLSADRQVMLGNQRVGICLYQCAQGQTIGLPAVDHHNIIGGNAQYGIFLWRGVDGDPRPSNNVIQNNFIGCNDDALQAAMTNGTYALYIFNGDNNLIGGDLLSLERNVLSGNTQTGSTTVYIFNGWNNRIQGNYVGTQDNGLSALPNSLGIHVIGYGNLIGGSTGFPFTGNVVSGNNTSGILVSDGGGNTVCGNIVGLNRTGDAVLPNYYGLSVSSPSTYVGGNSALLRNVIAGNTNIDLRMFNTRDCVVQGNYLGTAADGLSVFSAGIAINLLDTDYCLIGGTAAGQGNIICSSSVGARAEGYASGNTMVGNFIGVLADGSVQASAGFSGVYYFNNGNGNYLGLPGAGQGNLICGWDAGIRTDATVANNGFFGNTLTTTSNAPIGILAGANNNQPAPVNLYADPGLVSGAAQANDFIEVFLCDDGLGTYPDPVRFIGSTTADGISGHWQMTPGGLSPGQYVCAIATDTNNNSSILSEEVEVQILPTTPTFTPTATMTASPTFTPSPTITPTPTATPTLTVTPTNALAQVDLRGKPALAFPNPAQDQMTFVFHTGQEMEVAIEIYNFAGEQIVKLEGNFAQGQGHTLAWDCGGTAPGIYLARVRKAGEVKGTLKIAIVQ
ncbi:T9SS type A sorting domain-containing protein [candidate division FCPU426 bacterium]|nr:T9SS type A sorting domain-containing protein [candidate division FCPU426 bacterium]